MRRDYSRLHLLIPGRKADESEHVRRYLDSVMHLAYTLLRMLEKYSKSKAYMYVRKKKAGRAAAKKKRQKSAYPFAVVGNGSCGAALD